MEIEIKKKPRIALIGHMGIGSIFGLIPSFSNSKYFNEYQQELNNKYIINKYQKWLMSVWESCKVTAGVPDEYPTTVVFGGELVEGYSPAEKCEDIWSPRLQHQINMAVPLMMEWIGEETEDVIILYGHSYHGSYSREFRIEDLIASQFKMKLSEAGLKPQIEVGPCVERTYFDLVFRFLHGGDSTMNRASALERGIKENLLRSALFDVPAIDYSLQFHSHTIAGSQYSSKYAYWMPAFKLQDTTASFRKPDSWFPDVGMGFITIQKRFDNLRVNVDFFTEKAPFRFDELQQHVWNKDNIKEDGTIFVDTCDSLPLSKPDTVLPPQLKYVKLIPEE